MFQLKVAGAALQLAAAVNGASFAEERLFPERPAYSLPASTQPVQSDPLRVPVLRQLHKSPTDPNAPLQVKDYKPEILKSQLEVAIAAIGCVVFLEGTAQIPSQPGALYQDPAVSIEASLMKKLFPLGIPKTLEALREIDDPKGEWAKAIAAGEITKDEILSARLQAVYSGGVRLAALLGEATIAPCCTLEQEVENRIGFAILLTKFGSFEGAMMKSPEFRFLVTDKREHEWAEATEKWFAAHPGFPVDKTRLCVGIQHEKTLGDEKASVKFQLSNSDINSPIAPWADAKVIDSDRELPYEERLARFRKTLKEAESFFDAEYLSAMRRNLRDEIIRESAGWKDEPR